MTVNDWDIIKDSKGILTIEIDVTIDGESHIMVDHVEHEAFPMWLEMYEITVH